MSDNVFTGDCRSMLCRVEPGSVQCCVTSPPYWGLRDYGHDGQMGQEETLAEYIAGLVEVMALVREALADDGTLWLNLGDCYAGTGKSGGGKQGRRWEEAGAKVEGPRGGRWQPPPDGLKRKDLVGLPWRVAFALQDDGWWLRSDVVWAKDNPMPESVKDRPTRAHEFVFLLSKSARYFYDGEAIREPAVGASSGNGFVRPERLGMNGRGQDNPWQASDFRNARDVWRGPSQPFAGAHFAVMPPWLAERCILAGSRPGDTVLDPFMGAGTTWMEARKNGRGFVGVEINPLNVRLAEQRVRDKASQLTMQAEGTP